MTELAERQNIVVKVGGLGMAMGWFDFYQRPSPPGSQELADAFKPWVETCVELFGVNRCMYESNFPVDKITSGYGVLWAQASDTASASRRARFCWDSKRVWRSREPNGGHHASPSCPGRGARRLTSSRSLLSAQTLRAVMHPTCVDPIWSGAHHAQLRPWSTTRCSPWTEVPGEAADGRQLHDQRRRPHLTLLRDGLNGTMANRSRREIGASLALGGRE